MVADDDALVQRLVHRHGQAPAQLGEADQEHAQARLGIHGEVGEQLQVLEDFVAQVLRFIDDEERERILVSRLRRQISVWMARQAVPRQAHACDRRRASQIP